MSRKEEFEIVKSLIKKHYGEANCGLFDSRNILGDPMFNLFIGKFFTLDICYAYAYFEVFRTTKEEFDDLEKFYKSLESEGK